MGFQTLNIRCEFKEGKFYKIHLYFYTREFLYLPFFSI